MLRNRTSRVGDKCLPTLNRVLSVLIKFLTTNKLLPFLIVVVKILGV